MGNLCSRRDPRQAAYGALPQEHMQILAIQDNVVLENDQYQVALRRQRDTPLATGTRKLIRAIIKIVIILKLRIRHSQIKSWQNVNRALKGTGNQAWKEKASLLSKLTSWLHQRGSRQLCQHVKRVSGKLRYKSAGDGDQDEQL